MQFWSALSLSLSATGNSTITPGALLLVYYSRGDGCCALPFGCSIGQLPAADLIWIDSNSEITHIDLCCHALLNTLALCESSICLFALLLSMLSPGFRHNHTLMDVSASLLLRPVLGLHSFRAVLRCSHTAVVSCSSLRASVVQSVSWGSLCTCIPAILSAMPPFTP
jgi:hypothetical protein